MRLLLSTILLSCLSFPAYAYEIPQAQVASMADALISRLGGRTGHLNSGAPCRFDEFLSNGTFEYTLVQTATAATLAKVILSPDSRISGRNEDLYFPLLEMDVTITNGRDVRGIRTWMEGDSAIVTISRGMQSVSCRF